MNSEATFGETPAWSSQVAVVCRDSCSPIGLNPPLLPTLLHPGLERVERKQAGLANHLRRADLAARRPPLRLPLLVPGQLSAAGLEVEVLPIENLNLLVARAAVAGQGEGQRVFLTASRSRVTASLRSAGSARRHLASRPPGGH